MGRQPYSKNRKMFEVTKLWNTHQEIIRLHVTGMKSVDIAKELNLSQDCISYTLNSEIVKARVLELQTLRDTDSVDIAKRISEIQPKALDLLDDVISGNVNATMGQMIGTAQDMLDRGGHSAVKKVETKSLHIGISKAELDKVKENGRSVAIAIGLVKVPEGDVTVETIDDSPSEPEREAV